jgi:hypothetical protein
MGVTLSATLMGELVLGWLEVGRRVSWSWDPLEEFLVSHAAAAWERRSWYSRHAQRLESGMRRPGVQSMVASSSGGFGLVL